MWIDEKKYRDYKNEIDSINSACPKVDFQLFDLPAFGRPMKSTEQFGNDIFKFIL